jgi:Xaa-Pro dipeptidase
LEGEEQILEKIQPGVTAGELFEVAIERVKMGIPQYKRHHVGHGIGLEIYEPPMLVPHSDFELQPGMVLCVETPYYELEWGGLQVEDMIVVTENGYRLLTKSNRELIEIDDL